MSNVVDFLKRAAERNGYVRDRYQEKNIPTDISNITIMPFFPDLRSMAVGSMLLMRRFKEEAKGSKYFILCSWPGFESLFPYVDEYWSYRDFSQLKNFYKGSIGFKNTSELSTLCIRNLNEFFKDVVDYRDLVPYYDNGITGKFFEYFRNIKKYLPMISSTAILDKNFNYELANKPGYKVFISPSINAKSWYMGTNRNVTVKKEFWIELCKRLINTGFTPVIWNHYLNYNISDQVQDGIYLQENDISKVLVAMRACSCVLDVFNSISRLAIIARCPFLAVTERTSFNNLKEYEIDDLMAHNLPFEYIFSFSTIIINGELKSWDGDLFNQIGNKLKNFMPKLNRDQWPSTGEVNEISPYERVRKITRKKLGTRLFKVPKE